MKRQNKKTPSVILLDDVDKFASVNEDCDNAEEYVVLKYCIDDIKNSDVFVIATANYLSILPDSLRRMGRFDNIIEILPLDGDDAEKIIEHYLSKKQSVEKIDYKELSRILNGMSCAELEIIINQAGIYAGFENREKYVLMIL